MKNASVVPLSIGGALALFLLLQVSGAFAIDRFEPLTAGDVARADDLNARFDALVDELNDHYEEVSFEVSSSAVTYDASSEVTALRSIQFRGVRVGNTFHLGFSAQFELGTNNNYVDMVISLAGTPVTDRRSIESASGTHITNVNGTGEPTSPGRIVGGAVYSLADSSSVGLNFLGQFREAANRVLVGTVVITTVPD